MKILVAGAGIAGSVLTTQLRAAGHEVTLADGRPDISASQCAFAYMRLGWFRGPDRDAVKYALDWYRGQGHLLTSQAWVRDVRRGSFQQDGHYLVHPTGPLVAPDVHRNVYGYRSDADGVWVLMDDSSQAHRVDRLVLACGAGTDRWGAGTPTYGGVFESRRYRMNVPLRLLRVTDRLTHVAADDGTVVRVGASKGRTPAEALQRAASILGRMMDEGMIPSSIKWVYRSGARWTNLTGGSGPAPVEDRVWTFTGFSRTGYALVPAAARDFVSEMSWETVV